MQQQATSHMMLTAATATGASEAFQLGSNAKTFQVWGNTSSGTGSATVQVEVSNELTAPWLLLTPLTLTLGTAAVADGCAMEAGWRYVRVNVTAISGTGANISAALGL